MTEVMQPLQVEITNPAKSKEYFYRSTFKTVVITATSTPPGIELLVAGPDETLEEVILEIKDGTTILCGSLAQAQDPNNVAATPNNPQGMIVYTGQITTRIIKTCGPVYAVCAPGVYPNRIGICEVHRVCK